MDMPWKLDSCSSSVKVFRIPRQLQSRLATIVDFSGCVRDIFTVEQCLCSAAHNDTGTSAIQGFKRWVVLLRLGQILQTRTKARRSHNGIARR
jgi:hypothetical protein